MTSPFLSAIDIHKAFDGVPVLRGVDLHIQRTETVCLLGPSGCGKTTLLRIIAGLEQPDRGQILREGVDIANVPAHRRGFGLMFQDFMLFPHLSVAENLAFGLRMQQWPDHRIRTRVQELLELVELSGYGRRRVFELSGGQQQRVALARSLAPQPPLLMLDEPLGSLDRVLRDQLLTDLRQLLESLQQTAVYVTHDQHEAFAIADRIVLMNEGHIEQEASPDQLYLHPATAFAARFLGFKNIIPAETMASGPDAQLSTPVGLLRPANLPDLPAGARLQVVIRPEGARLTSASEPAVNRLSLPLAFRSLRGANTLIQLRVAGFEQPSLEFELPGAFPGLVVGEIVTLAVDPAAIVALAK